MASVRRTLSDLRGGGALVGSALKFAMTCINFVHLEGSQLDQTRLLTGKECMALAAESLQNKMIEVKSMYESNL